MVRYEFIDLKTLKFGQYCRNSRAKWMSELISKKKKKKRKKKIIISLIARIVNMKGNFLRILENMNER